MDEEYRRLTTSVNVDGKEHISCVWFGTEQCHGNCASCEMMRAILKQLWAFEEVYTSN